MIDRTVERDLFSQILRFRFYRIVFSAEIAKMYRALALDDNDKDFLRLLRCDSPETPLHHLRMTRDMYGVVSSAFQSVRCLNKIGDLTNLSMLNETIQNDIYVNNCLGGAEEAFALQVIKG